MSVVSTILARFRRETSNTQYFPELDGVRFFCVFMVIFFHGNGYFMSKAGHSFIDTPEQHSIITQILINFHVALPLFFTLSALMVSMPFAKQYLLNGKKIEYKEYYVRRAVRLMPAYLAMLVLLLGAHLVMKTHPPALLFKSFAASLIYQHNIIFTPHPSYLSVVFWSLEVEIQFYLIAPLLFQIFRLPKIPRRLIFAGISIACTLAKIYLKPTTVTIFDFAEYFPMGLIIADLYYTKDFEKILSNNKVIPFFLVSIFFIVYYAKHTIFANYGDTLPTMISPFLICFFMYTLMCNKTLGKIFGWKYLATLGGMSYSMYLVHYTIISMLGRFLLKVQITNYYLPNLFFFNIAMYIIVLPFTFVLFYYFEKPFMSRKWLDWILTPPSTAYNYKPEELWEPPAHWKNWEKTNVS